MTAGTRETPAGTRAGRLPLRPRPDGAPAGRLRLPAWLDGPLTSAHLVFGAAGLLLSIGLVMVFSASSIEAALDDEPAWAPGARQVVWAGIGLAACLATLRLSPGFLRRWSRTALLAAVVLLVAVLVPGLGKQLNGARQWISLGFADFQPSEVAKLVVALWGAHVIAVHGRHLTTRSLLVPLLPVAGLVSGLFLLEPDFGSVAGLSLVLLGLLWAGGVHLRHLGWLVGIAAAAIVLMVMVAPYRMARITAFLDPFADPTDGGFQAIRGFYALATGGFWGVGLGNSAMKWDLLPHAESDYIFAIIGEELGFLGCLVVIGLYAVLAYAGFRIAKRTTDRFIQLASVAITTWLVGQAAMNMGYVVGLLPVTGVTLPLISAGGTSLVLTLAIVGILGRFALTEPEAIEHRRNARRNRLSRLLLPLPTQAVDPVHTRRAAASRRTLRGEPPGRGTGRPAGPGSARRTPAGRTGASPRVRTAAPPRPARPRTERQTRLQGRPQ